MWHSFQTSPTVEKEVRRLIFRSFMVNNRNSLYCFDTDDQLPGDE